MSRDDASGVGLGIDIGGTTTRVATFDGDRLLDLATSATPTGPSALVDHVAAEITAAVERADRPLVRVGVGVPGSVRRGTVAMALNVGIDEPLPLAALLHDHTGVPVTVENDVNAAALGAHVHLGAAAGTSLTYLSIGTGVAAGTVIAGDLVRGRFGAAGEMGHVPIPGRPEACPCGQVGCIEQIASGRALVARMREVGLDGDAVALWDAADDGHPHALTIRDDAVGALAWACQVAFLLLDVEQVVLGGGVGVALGDRLLGTVRADLRARAARSGLLTAIRLDERVACAPTGVELGALGAHHAALAAAAMDGGGDAH